MVKRGMHQSRVYITHCSAKKDDTLKGTGRQVTPDLLYTATPTRRFMERCKEQGVRWAIFSDHYGVWFSDKTHEWYGDDVGDPGIVTEQRFRELVKSFEERLRPFNEIHFSYNLGRFHHLYRRLLEETTLKNRITMIAHLWDIT